MGDALPASPPAPQTAEVERLRRERDEARQPESLRMQAENAPEREMSSWDECYERQAARARSDDFAETGGKDWT